MRLLRLLFILGWLFAILDAWSSWTNAAPIRLSQAVILTLCAIMFIHDEWRTLFPSKGRTHD